MDILTFIVAPMVLSLLSGALAFIIVLVDSLVNNYPDFTIDINNGRKKLTAKGGSSLLVTLSSQGIFIPSACGGKASCGACKVKIGSDVGAILPTELPYLSEEEKKDNIRLACQIKLKNNIRLFIPEDLLYVKQFDATVESITDLTYDIKQIKLKLLSPDSIDFKAGQYVQLIIPPYGQIPEKTQRAYSMSNTPSDNQHVELLIRLVPGGLLTTYVHKFMQVNEKVVFTGPFGDFFLRDTKAEMICVAGGSGMAPIKSIIYDMYEKKNFDRSIWFFFGAKSARDLFYLDELKELEKLMPSFHFIPALSNPDPADNWKGETGLITNILDKYLKTAIKSSSPKEAYLCGSPGMIDATVKVLNVNGIASEKIYYDKFA